MGEWAGGLEYAQWPALPLLSSRALAVRAFELLGSGRPAGAAVVSVLLGVDGPAVAAAVVSWLLAEAGARLVEAARDAGIFDPTVFVL